MRRASLPIILIIAVVAVGAHLIARQGGVKPFTDADWPRFAGDFAGTKYSRLTQINTANVSRLVQAWSFQGVGTQQTPIVISGVMYASTPTGVVALDADTGSVVWRYGAVPAAGGRGGAGRGGRGAAAPAEPPQDGEPAPTPAAAGPPPAARGVGPAGVAPGAGGRRFRDASCRVMTGRSRTLACCSREATQPRQRMTAASSRSAAFRRAHRH